MLSILLTLSCLIFPPAHAFRPDQSLNQRKQILLLSITLEGAPGLSDTDAIYRELTTRNPDANVILVNHQWPRGEDEISTSRSSAALEKKLRVAIAEAGHFNLVALDLPGNDPHSHVVIPNDLEMSVQGIEERLQSWFPALRGTAARNAKILMLNPYSTRGPHDHLVHPVEGVLEFFGATHGSYFGLHGRRRFVPSFSVSQDLEAGKVFFAVALGVTVALIRLPNVPLSAVTHAWLPALALWGTWMGTFHATDATKWRYGGTALGVAGVTLLMGTLWAIPPAALLGVATPAFAKTLATSVGVVAPLWLTQNTLTSRWEAIKGFLKGTANQGSLFQRRQGSGFDVSGQNLWRDRAVLFECEAGLQNVAPEPVPERAALAAPREST